MTVSMLVGRPSTSRRHISMWLTLLQVSTIFDAVVAFGYVVVFPTTKKAKSAVWVHVIGNFRWAASLIIASGCLKPFRCRMGGLAPSCRSLRWQIPVLPQGVGTFNGGFGLAIRLSAAFDAS